MLSKSSIVNPVILFMHIPKTAGTSIRFAFEKKFSSKERIYIYDNPPGISLDEFQNISADKLSDIRFVHGHFRFGLHESFQQPAKYYTVLRDPVDRVISLYYHYKRNPGNWYHDIIRKEHLGLENFIRDERFLQADNEMTRQISACSDIPFGQCSGEILHQARENIENHFDLLLIMEELERSLQLLEERTSVKPGKLKKLNTNPIRLEKNCFARELVEEIEERNRFDRELYEFARHRLNTN
jgi:hypothetical protein